MTFLVYLGAIVCVVWGVVSIVIIRKQQGKEYDKGTSQTTVKHPIIANPILIAYIVFPILVIVGGLIWLYFTEK